MTDLRHMPRLMKVGLLLMGLAGVVDVVVHVAAGAHAAHGGFAIEHGAHLLAIAAMALVVAGVVIHGARRQLRQRAVAHGGQNSNATR